VVLLGLPALVILGFAVSAGWGAVADHYGRPIAAERAVEIEELARRSQLTAAQVKRADGGDGVPAVDRLEVPGTTMIAIRPPEGAGDAYVVLRSTAWSGLHCIVLAVGSDGDISTVVRRCA
jgi:hypothetical protein